MWGNRLEWEDHLNDQHPITSVLNGDSQRLFFVCRVCAQTFVDDHGGGDEARNPCTFRNSHYADHMERIALSVLTDCEPTTPVASTSALQMPIPKNQSKRRRRRQNRTFHASGDDSSSPGYDEEAISGWSSESSNCSQA